VSAEDRRPAQEAMKTRKPKIGGRYVAWMRGAFSWARVAASTAGKPEASVGASGATRANVGAGRANRVVGTPQSLGPTGPFCAGG
jgi:hypothetical protein